jgi:cytochrome d ubiquinol oxidase subunit II
VLPNPVEFGAVLAVLAAGWLAREHRSGWAFAATTVAMALAILSIFTELYPNVMISSTRPADSLTVGGTAASSYSLTVMTVVVAIFLPGVLAYTGWTYYVFRKRVSSREFKSSSSSAPGAAGQPRR